MAPKRNSYSFETKNEIILKVKSGVKRSQIYKEYGIASGTLSKWMAASQNIAAKVQDGKGKIMKSTPTPFPQNRCCNVEVVYREEKQQHRHR